MKSKKRKKAVAVSHSDERSAPIIKAKGNGLIADEIIQLAQENDIPIYEDKALVELLGKFDLNETIPEELYTAVAEVFAFIYRLDKEEQKRNYKINKDR
ncbi:EscU/YscU/HrcU family type III secretion system export apparatus switch protein [Caldibacillus thermolactis]|jgi:flagellar biosynthesis protein|uniref:EscU/YscU/HrcU family type III secretion system export apparatus switch protein n=1 Tax=Pallidibacillus thermolactis TaxID=251051 RepID=A0ABT2WBQ5_9BACI|nr:EscU/YscU/HrcU family type III secretion system export apparatus switch protein [Pallidibacillus thermolactis]MCU9593108.1 EscU/YscU/HrcU family type III secretion system export apparatus switch protein [Pallidibacillus thermolactis]MCU9600128.1 EscU/YscU/HrcU family type III secretion system export apparatus switch protein [Pallidibacillus thermolactis subsp. kokeshiiformis]MED1671991.1 EscU/YscU/HrcU family type III secretion system export apparatus switch protein [Pallidibacillus thermolac